MDNMPQMSAIMARDRSAADRRRARTRHAILQAFSALMFERRYDEFGVADIVDRANVGRSTFYEHFSGKDVLLREAMQPMLAVFAESATGKDNRARLTVVLAHFWQNRRMARIVFTAPMRGLIERQLAAIIADQDGQRLAAIQIATAQMAAIEAWTGGTIAASLDEMVSAVARTSALAVPQ
jgi:AcrR family transcriptional regulator